MGFTFSVDFAFVATASIKVNEYTEKRLDIRVVINVRVSRV